MRFTIKDAIIQVLEKRKVALSVKEIYDDIIKSQAYKFKSQNALAVLSTELRRHTEGSTQSKSRKILFAKLKDGKYGLLNITRK